MRLNNRSTPMSKIINLANTIGSLTSANCIMDIAAKNHYSYADYRMLCKCLERLALSEGTFIAHTREYQQLDLEGIY